MTTTPPSPTGPGQDPKFARDKFLVHQKVLSISSKYYVFDENEQPLFFVERPAFKLRAHIEIFDDDTKAAKRLRLRQDRIIAINQVFTLLTPDDQVICTFERQGLLSMLRRTWHIRGPDGQEIAQAREDSWGKAIFRRIGPFGEFMRTNFDIELLDGTKVGAFNRQLTLTDKYVLDLTDDPGRRLDRRIAVGLAILLDTAEGR